MSRRRSRLLAIMVAATFAGSAAAQPTPEAVYQMLLRTSIPDSQLTSGIHVKTIQKSAFLNSQKQSARKRHAIGNIEIDFNQNAQVLYRVFASHQDAIGFLEDTETRLHPPIGAAPSWLPQPSRTLTFSGSFADSAGKPEIYTLFEIVFTEDNVIVTASIVSYSIPANPYADQSLRHGTIPREISLARIAQTHLGAVFRHG